MIYVLSVAWLIGIPAALFAIYWFLIRPKAKWTEVAAGVDGFWARQWERTKAFRTQVTAMIGSLVVILPDLLQMLTGIDFAAILPQPWSIFAGPVVMIALALVRASATTPPGEPPSGEA